jgi:two-component system phosphate regulon sensor histidine kinase PhoR
VVPLLMLGSFLTYTGQGQSLNQSLAQMAYTASQSAQAVEAEVWAAVRVISELSHTPGLPAMIENNDAQGISALLDSVTQSHGSLAYVGLVRPDGSVIADKRPVGGLSVEILQNLPDHRYELFVAGQPIGPEPYLDSQGRGFLIAAFPVGPRGHQAALVGAVSMDRIDVRFHQVAGPTGFHHMLVDLSRNLVISDHDTRKRLVPLNSQGWPEALPEALRREGPVLVDRNGTNFYVNYSPIPSWGWGVMVYQDIQGILGQARWISWANLSALLATLGLTLLLSLASSQELALPILNLSWKARRIKEGHAGALDAWDAADTMEGELSEIASTLNVLVERITRADEMVDEHSRRLAEQTRQSQALQEANRRLSTLLGIAQDALQLEVELLLHTVVERLGRACSASVTLWWLEEGRPRPAAAFSPLGGSAAEASPSLNVQAAASSRAIVSSQVSLPDGSHKGWGMAVPIAVEGRPVAALELKRQGLPFTAEEQDMVEAAASVTAMALRLNHLYWSAQRQASLYRKLGQMAEQTLAPLDLQGTLQGILSAILELIPSRCGLALYLDSNGNSIVADKDYHCLLTPRDLMNRLLPYLTKADLVHSDEFPGELPLLGIDAWSALALRNGGLVQGIVVLGLAHSRPLYPEERDALLLAARTASLALQRSQLLLTATQQRDLANTIVNMVPLAIVLADVWEKRILLSNGTAASAGLNNIPVLEEAGFWQLMIRTAQWMLPYKARELLWARDGSSTYWDLNIWPMGQASGTVLLAAHDVTTSITYRERIQNLAKLAEQGRIYLESILNSMTEGILIVSQDLTISFANPRANLLLGAGDLNGRPLQELANSLEEAGVIGPQARTFLLDLGRSADRMEIDLNFARPRSLACQWFEISVAGSERVMGLLIRDITTQRELDRFRDNLISMVSHELRTPLTTILGFSELASVKEFSLPEIKRMLKMIHREAVQLADMVSEFLEAGKLTAQGFRPHLTPVDLAEVIENTLEVFRHNADHHTFEAQIPPKLPTIYADEPGIRQVLQNLLANAAKYTPSPGKITVSVNLSESEVTVSVADTGLGIPEQEKEKIFERFYRVEDHTRRGIRGTGLGLTIAREIVAAHKGRIWVESRLGEGSTFYFTLPLDLEPSTK